jgi:hypothetical protein
MELAIGIGLGCYCNSELMLPCGNELEVARRCIDDAYVIVAKTC